MKVGFAATPLIALDAVAIDLETTSLVATSARIIDIGAVALRHGKADPSQSFHRLVNPGIPVPAETTAVHGMTDEALANAPPLERVLPELEEFVGKCVLIGHNLAYDLAVLNAEYHRVGRRAPQCAALDIRVLAQLITPPLAHDNLPQLCEWLGLGCSNLNSAPGDALAMARIYEALVPRLRDVGIRTVAEAIAASRNITGKSLSPGIEGSGEANAAANETRSLAEIDSYPYRHRVSEVMSQPALVIDGSVRVREAIGTLMKRGTSSVFVRDNTGQYGIVTERDLLRAIAESGEPALSRNVDTVMSKPLVTVDADAFLYRALARIEKFGIRHLAVTNANGDVVGAVTPRNLLHQRARAALVLGEDIETATSTAELGAALARLTRVAESLTAEEVDPRRIAAVISTEIAAATRRASILAEQSMEEDGWGKPPQPYAVFIMGSGGRGESLLAADQDNAIVFAEGEPGSPADRWFEELGMRLTQYLDEAGVPLCKGGVMARNPQWRHSVAGWRGVIEGWVRRQRPEDLLNVDIFFDGMGVHGDLAMADEIRTYAFELGQQSKDFIGLLTELARQWSPPLNFLGAIRTDDGGRVDLKKGGLMPIFTGARVLAIRHNILARSTPERLRAILERGKVSSSDIRHVIDAHQVFMSAMLKQQLADAAQGIALSPRVSLEGYDNEARGILKKAINEVRTMIDLVGEGRL